jgi:hypothetical protein
MKLKIKATTKGFSAEKNLLDYEDYTDYKEEWPKVKGYEEWKKSLGNLAGGIDSSGEMAHNMGLSRDIIVAYLTKNGITYVTGVFYPNAGYGSINKDFSINS